MATISTGLNPNITKTALDDVFFQAWDGEQHPNYATAMDSRIFKQKTTTKAAEIIEVFKGTGYWEERQEEQSVPMDTTRAAFKTTYSVLNYAKSLDVSKNFFDDDQHNVWEHSIEDMGRKARLSKDKNALDHYVGGFATYTVPGGDFIFSDTHTTQSGDTVDNLGTAALSETALDTGIQALINQKDQAGTLGGSLPKCLLVPPALFKKATEIADSELRSNTANNDLNVYLVKYGIWVLTSPFLSAAHSRVTGADAYWYLNGDNHSMTRWVRQDIQTSLVDWQYQRNNNYIYKGEFREMVGTQDYVGLWASTGA